MPLLDESAVEMQKSVKHTSRNLVSTCSGTAVFRLLHHPMIGVSVNCRAFATSQNSVSRPRISRILSIIR
jgi:hypothetical protein